MTSGNRDFALDKDKVDAKRSVVDLDLRNVRSHCYRKSIDLFADTGEFYDMHEDPDKMYNLFDDPTRVAIRDEHIDIVRSLPDTIISAATRVGWHTIIQ